jgi:hypothetical protein
LTVDPETIGPLPAKLEMETPAAELPHGVPADGPLPRLDVDRRRPIAGEFLASLAPPSH